MKKTILITGCSSGFGYITATYLAQSGYHVYATVRKKTDLTIFLNLPKKHRPEAILLDVTWSQKRINEVINRLQQPIDVLINNAGFGYLGAVSTLSIDQFQQQLDTNLLGVFKVTKSVLPQMRLKQKGLIINISSIAGLVAFAGYGIYSASKFAVEALTQALHIEESLFGIDVISLNPGSFETRFWQNERFPVAKSSSKTPNHNRFNQRIQAAVQKSNAYRGQPHVVAKKIKKLIESNYRPVNNPVGTDAHIIYFLNWLLPKKILFFIAKRITNKLV